MLSFDQPQPQPYIRCLDSSGIAFHIILYHTFSAFAPVAISARCDALSLHPVTLREERVGQAATALPT